MDDGNVFDPYAITFKVRLPGRIEATSIIDHIPREISHFCHFVLRGGELRGKVTSTEFRRSPLPQGGIEISIAMLYKR